MRLKLIFCLLLWKTVAIAQETAIPGMSDSSLLFVDSVESKQGLAGLDPRQIAIINIVKGAKLREKFGSRGADGVIYVETIPFARRRYTKMFSDISSSFAKALKQYGTDSSFQYILDGSVLTQSVEQMLAALEKGTIGSIDVIPPKVLKEQYEVDGKQLGVIIRSRVK